MSLDVHEVSNLRHRHHVILSFGTSYEFGKEENAGSEAEPCSCTPRERLVLLFQFVLQFLVLQTSRTFFPESRQEEYVAEQRHLTIGGGVGTE
jgi:hypothetical protein